MVSLSQLSTQVQENKYFTIPLCIVIHHNLLLQCIFIHIMFYRKVVKTHKTKLETCNKNRET